MAGVQKGSRSHATQWIAVAALVGVNALWGLSFPIMKSLNLQMEQFFGLENDSVPSTLSVAFSSGMIGLRFLMSLGVLYVFCPNLVRGASLHHLQQRAGLCIVLGAFLAWTSGYPRK